jgi:hypothetical protein
MLTPEEKRVLGEKMATLGKGASKITIEVEGVEEPIIINTKEFVLSMDDGIFVHGSTRIVMETAKTLVENMNMIIATSEPMESPNMAVNS